MLCYSCFDDKKKLGKKLKLISGHKSLSYTFKVNKYIECLEFEHHIVHDGRGGTRGS
jgi:hypothetical protein